MAERDASANKVLAAVTALARDLAPDELAVRVTRADVLPVEVTVQHAAAFAVAIEAGRGPLPETVRQLGSMAELRAELDQRLDAVRGEAGALIDTWVTEHGATYTSMLQAERCMRDRPVLGVQEVCAACGGRKELTCGGCGGHGRVTCGRCGGRGRVTCSGCGGTRASRCHSCGGSGTHEVREFETSYSDQQSTMNQQRQLTRQVPCPGCGGRGSNPCTACADGTQACTCSSGQVTCGGCGGRGIVSCGQCAATGVVHHTGRIQCTVNRGIRVDVPGGDDEDRHTLRDRVRFERLGAMASDTGGVRLEAAKRVEHQATLHYAGSLRREFVEATARGRAVTIRAYGGDLEVFDHHDLVGTLLEPDLAALESSLRGHALRSAVPGSSVVGAVRRFLASELHALIAEAAPQIAEDASGERRVGLGRVIVQALLLAPVIRRFRRAGVLMKLLMAVIAVNVLLSPQVVAWYLVVAAACAFSERRYQRDLPRGPLAEDRGPETSSANAVQAAVTGGLVNADYVRRARVAIGRAVPRLHGPLMLSGGLWLTGALTLLFLVAKQTFPGFSMSLKALVLLVATGAAWFFLERRASASLQTMLGAALYARLKTRFSVTPYRVIPIGGLLLAWFLADFLVNLVAHIRYGAPLFP